MIITVINMIIASTAVLIGGWVIVKHLNAFNHTPTQAKDLWLVSVGSLAWSVALLSYADLMIEMRSINSADLGLSRAELLTNALLFMYWSGTLLQIKKHCVKMRLRKRKLERQKEQSL